MPSRKVANLELLLTQDKAPRHKALSGVEEDAWARRMRYLKASAAGHELLLLLLWQLLGARPWPRRRCCKPAGSLLLAAACPAVVPHRLLSRTRATQVGAAAVGGGALFAVTGGLAAPAIAAGMGR